MANKAKRSDSATLTNGESLVTTTPAGVHQPNAEQAESESRGKPMGLYGRNSKRRNDAYYAKRVNALIETISGHDESSRVASLELSDYVYSSEWKASDLVVKFPDANKTEDTWNHYRNAGGTRESMRQRIQKALDAGKISAEVLAEIGGEENWKTFPNTTLTYSQTKKVSAKRANDSKRGLHVAIAYAKGSSFDEIKAGNPSLWKTKEKGDRNTVKIVEDFFDLIHDRQTLGVDMFTVDEMMKIKDLGTAWKTGDPQQAIWRVVGDNPMPTVVYAPKQDGLICTLIDALQRACKQANIASHGLDNPATQAELILEEEEELESVEVVSKGKKKATKKG